MTVWSYKIGRDFGFAPNPFFGFCTVACCKPKIRNLATVGDLVIGCGSKALNMEGRIIFGMLIEERLTFDEYWNDKRFLKKRPCFTSGKAQMYGDNIYHSDAAGAWAQENSHHSLDNGGWNEANASRDLNSKLVLISKKFSYFGHEAIQIPPYLRNFAGDDLYPNVRDFRNGFTVEMQMAAVEWFNTLPRGRIGRPISW